MHKTSNSKRKKIVKKIISRLEPSLFSLPLAKQWHYCDRMYKITGNEKYLPAIVHFFKSNETKLQNLLKILLNKKSQVEWANENIDYLLEKENLNKKRIDRYKKLKKFPRFKYFRKLVWYIRRHKHYGFSKYESEINKALNLLQRVKWEKYLLNEDIVSADPIHTINTFYSLLESGVKLDKDRFIGEIKKLINSNKSVSFSSKLFSFTHIVINESGYYQTFIRKEELNWIYMYLDNNFSKVLEVDNLDLLFEVGIVYLLAKDESKKLNKIRKMAVDKFEPKVGLFLKEEQKQTDLEHRNVLAIILLSDINRFYNIPTLRLD